MAFYSICFRTSAGDELLYEGYGDQLMQDLEFAVDGSSRTGTVLVEHEKSLIRKEVFEELSRIRKSFGKKKLPVLRFSIAFSMQKRRNLVLNF